MLTSARNPKVVAAVRLKKRALREQEGRFLVEGGQGVSEALADTPRLTALFVTDDLDPLAVRARQAGIEVEHVSSGVIERLTSTVTPQGVVGVAPFVDVPIAHLSPGGTVAVLHEVRDPGNAGTILRSADAAGASGVVMTGSSVDVYNPKTVRASAGSIFHVPVVRGIGTREALEALRERGFGIVAMDAHGEADLFEAPLPGATAFVFGNEAHGLPEDLARGSDLHVRVPHAGRAESLNLAAAATVCLFERMRRGGTEEAPDGTPDAGTSRGTETLESLVAAAAHDIRSPLTAMKGFGYALEKRWVDMTDEQRDLMLTGILYDADRMDTIVRQLVDAARVLSGRFEPFPEMTDVGGLVRQVSDQLARDPEHPPIRWSGDARPTMLDAGRLKTTIVAFAEALAWWAGEGDIEIDASLDGSLHLTASRASPPIDAAAIEDLFEARAPGSGGGSKIGLYVARRVAEAQGGRTWGEHLDGRLVFHVELPAGGPATGTP